MSTYDVPYTLFMVMEEVTNFSLGQDRRAFLDDGARDAVITINFPHNG